MVLLCLLDLGHQLFLGGLVGSKFTYDRNLFRSADRKC